jgi:autotransporter-associated beta strand protein
MKTLTIRRGFAAGNLLAAGTLALLVLAGQVHAATSQYWDTSTSAGIQTGTGVWDVGTTSLWSTNANPIAGSLNLWTNDNDANFSGTGTNTVTLSGAVSANTLTNSTATSVISGAGTLTLTCTNTSNANYITVNSASSLTINSAVILTPNGGRALFTGSGVLTINGNIGETAQTTLRAGGSAITLGGSNTFTGGVQISGGNSVTITDTAALGLGTATNAGILLGLNGSGTGTVATMNFNLASNSTVSKSLLLGGQTNVLTTNNFAINSTGAGVVTLAGTTLFSGQLGVSALFAGAGTMNLQLGGTNTGANTYQSALSNSSGNGTNYLTSLTKNGTGEWILTGASTYSGGTIVNAGTLLINNISGSGVGTGSLTVNSGGTLGGNGSIASAVTLNSGGNLTPGVSGTGLLTISNSLTLLAGSTTTFSITATNNFSSINLGTNALTYGGALIFNINGYTPTAGDTFQLFTLGSTNATSSGISLAGTQSGNFISASGIWSLTNGSGTWQYTDSTGVLAILAVPEPSDIAFIAFSGLALVIAMRRRRKMA